MDTNTKYFLIDSKVLPEIFLKVIEAKNYLKCGKALNATEASKMAGISRSAFYKYKDCVYKYIDKSGEKIITINAVLKDIPGVLSKICEKIYLSGANILTLNQNIPIKGLAPITITIRFDENKYNYDELLTEVNKLEGIISLENILE